MDSNTPIDQFLLQEILEPTTFMAVQTESFRSISKGSIGDYLRGIAFLADEDYEISLEFFKSGSSRGDPYCCYELYRIYSTDNEFELEPNRYLALYYLICSVLNFSLGVITEDFAHQMLFLYMKKFDAENKSVCLSVLRDTENESTNFDRKDLAADLFRLLMENDYDSRKKMLASLSELEQIPNDFILLYIRLNFPKNVEKVIMKKEFVDYMMEYPFELILYFN